MKVIRLSHSVDIARCICSLPCLATLRSCCQSSSASQGDSPLSLSKDQNQVKHTRIHFMEEETIKMASMTLFSDVFVIVLREIGYVMFPQNDRQRDIGAC